MMKQIKNKLTFETLSVEITRRCQLKCAHCLRGDAQNVDLSYEAIDNLLGQTDAIWRLFFSGGEPTLALDQMEYFLDKMIDFNIPLTEMKFITNAYDRSNKIFDLIKRYSEYIRLCTNNGTISKQVNPGVIIIVSTDTFHKGYDPKQAAEYYKTKLDGYATVEERCIGNIPHRLGRAKNIKYSVDSIETKAKKQRIEIYSKETYPFCLSFKDRKLDYENQIIVLCPVYLSANGNFYDRNVAVREFEYMDENTPICNLLLDTDILEKIQEYNKHIPCCLKRIIDMSVQSMQPDEELKRMLDTLNFVLNAPGKWHVLYNTYNRVMQQQDAIKSVDGNQGLSLPEMVSIYKSYVRHKTEYGDKSKQTELREKFANIKEYELWQLVDLYENKRLYTLRARFAEKEKLAEKMAENEKLADEMQREIAKFESNLNNR